MIRHHLVEPISSEPADGDVYLSLSHQTPVMNDPQQKSRQHEAQRRLRIDAGPAVICAVEIGDLVAEPGQVENPIDADKNVVVRDQLAERASDKKLKLTSLSATQHR